MLNINGNSQEGSTFPGVELARSISRTFFVFLMLNEQAYFEEKLCRLCSLESCFSTMTQSIMTFSKIKCFLYLHFRRQC
jgi:hypothetical protein